MKILVLTPAFNNHSGGVQAHSRHLTSAFAQLPGVDSIHIVDFRPTQSSIHRISERLRTVKELLRCNPSRFNLCWVTHLDLAPLARLARMAGGPPYVLSCHGIEIQKKLPPHKLWGLRGADQLAAVSRWTQSLLIDRQGIPAEKIQIFPNTFTPPPEIPEKQSARDFLRERFSISPGPVFLYLGRLRPEDRAKGYATVLEIVARLSSQGITATFIAAGEGPDRDWLKARAKDLDIAKQLICPGKIPDSELPLYFAGADLFTMPSTKEGFGIVFLEAMAHGTPALGGNRDGSIEPLADGKLGLLCDPDDLNSMTQIIRDFLSDPDHPLKDSARLIRSVNEQFGPEAYGRRLQAMLQNVLQNTKQ